MGNRVWRSVSRRLSTDRRSKGDPVCLSYAKGRWNRIVEFGWHKNRRYYRCGRGVYERCNGRKSGCCSAGDFDPKLPIRISLLKLVSRLNSQPIRPPNTAFSKLTPVLRWSAKRWVVQRRVDGSV